MQLNGKGAIRLVTDLMTIAGRSGEEGEVAQFVVKQLRDAGVPKSAIDFDTANRRSPIGGQCGNLIVKLPGTMRAPRRLLMAHLDTVPLCVGCRPVRRGEYIVSKDRTTALGGDDRAGVAVVLNSVLEILKHGYEHPPLTLLWPVQEEIGLVGARHVSLSKLGRPRLCFNWDGGAPDLAITAATGAEYMDITVRGIASHAGAHPEDGINALTVASVAIAELERDGWLGKIVKGRKTGTSNIGIVTGGAATNVVMPEVELRAEARSHSTAFRGQIVNRIRQAFERAATQVHNAAGDSAGIEFHSELKYESFRIGDDEPVVQAALAAVEHAGRTGTTRVCDGGLDANWLSARGFPTVTLGCGQQGIHTVHERLHIPSFLDACRIGLILATASEQQAV